MKRFILLSIIGFATSCQFDNSIDQVENKQQVYNNVDPQLWPYFRAFEEAAAEHGIFVDLSRFGTSGEIENIPETNVAGTCQYSSQHNHVTIDNAYWNSSTTNAREFVVFHELGHCVLKRGHDDSKFSNGACKSIMQSGLSDCNVLYNSVNKAYYLEELFSRMNTLASN